MTNKEKVIAAFLVSMGLFTVQYVDGYVKSLTAKEKVSFYSLAKSGNDNIMLCSTSPEASKTQVSETQKKV